MSNPSLPQTMKAVIVEKTGDVDVLHYRTDVPVPQPGDGQVLVKNEFIGINYIDTYFRTGLYPTPLPYTPGREAAGTIAATGPSNVPSDLSPGTRVAYMGAQTYAEYTVALASATVPLPSSISTKTAAAALLQALTALTLIRESHPVQRGDWILVTAAAGGVGLWLCQLLKAVGARTIAVASSEEKRNLAKENGAEVTIGYFEDDREKMAEEVMRITGEEGVAAVFDSVGKDTFDTVLKCVRRKGSLVSFGNASGPVTGFALSRLSPKNIRLLRPQLFGYIATREELLQYANELWDLINKDNLQVKIHDVYPLEDVIRATKDIESRKTTGKLLLKP
ncbi:NAD(P)-binding protein [Sporormia fimetaria CBS 119925]|uniref:Probable quinone oxidoreductase n=1 Tax=Sporormia fimetaria CBS 119925 TaxID=1340428 RepID=A0A6A6V3R8_9PLEO|nr:NAD(P)-binding protein [Sporormia fimetaria CBS 119925]